VTAPIFYQDYKLDKNKIQKIDTIFFKNLQANYKLVNDSSACWYCFSSEKSRKI